MIYIYNTATGRIVQSVDCPDDHAEHYERDGHAVIVTDQRVDINANYIVDGGFVAIPGKPSEYHVWDWPTHAWIRDRALAEKSVRAKRASLLNATVDKINAVRWAAMGEPQRTTWDTYRTALLDITAQPGFPFDIQWPIAPQ